jgi:hypothetical protein
VSARTTAAGLACLYHAHPHLTGDPCAQDWSAAPPRWSSRPGEPFAGLPKCFEGAGQKEVSYAGQREPARAARVSLGGGSPASLAQPPPHSVARVCCMRTGARLWTHVVPLLERIREGPSGTTLSWQCSRSTTNTISELLLFCVCVCVMRYIFISVLFSLGVRGVCVRCGYEDRIHFGRILEEL